MTTADTDPKAGDLKAILASIKSRLEKVDDLSSQLGHVRARLFSDVYQYVEGLIAQGLAKSVRHGCELLAATVKRKRGGITHYYECGAYMRANLLKPDDVNHTSVWLAAMAGHSIPKADYLRTVDAVRKGESPGAVAKLVFRGKLKSGADSMRRAARIVKDGRLTKETIQMEMLACLTLLRKHFKVKGGNLAFCDGSGEILMVVGEDV